VIEVIDPESQTVVRAFPDITADNTFTHSFTAGEAQGVFDKPMTVSGNYRMTVSYTVPGEDFEREEVEFVFEYDAESRRTTTTPGGPAGTTTAPPSTVFQSNVDGIRVGVPDGWIAEDVDNEAYQQRLNERSGYANELVELCPQDQTLPQIGGGSICPDGVQDGISVYRFGYLQSQPAFADVVAAGNRNITISDLLAYFIQFMEEKAGYSNFGVVQNVDRDVSVIDAQTNEIVSTTTGKFIEMTMTDDSGISGNDFAFLVMGTDGNTGYVLLPLIPGLPEELPAEQQQIFDSFELLAPNNTSPQPSPDVSTSPPQIVKQQPSSSPFTQQIQSPQQPNEGQQQQLQEQQQNQGGGTDVSIVPGSSSLTTDAYAPNPVQVSTGATVTWTNDDAQPHTATSGQNLTPDGRFDSGIMAPGATFEHTFIEEGEYPYFCLLHPNMVGTVQVG
jgi:plastocyanin